MNLSNFAKALAAIAVTSAGTSTINGSVIDTQGFNGVWIIIHFGTAAADNTLKAQQGAASNLSDAADLADTQVGVGASDEIVWLDIYRPRERYVRCVALRGTSTTISWGVALLYGAESLPVDNAVAGTIHGEFHQEPAEGTA